MTPKNNPCDTYAIPVQLYHFYYTLEFTYKSSLFHQLACFPISPLMKINCYEAGQ